MTSRNSAGKAAISRSRRPRSSAARKRTFRASAGPPSSTSATVFADRIVQRGQIRRPVLGQPGEAGMAQDAEQPGSWILAGEAGEIAKGAQAGFLHHILRHRHRCGSASAPDCRQHSYGAGPPARNRRAAVVRSPAPFLRCIPTSDTRPGGSAIYSRKYSGSGKAPRLFDPAGFDRGKTKHRRASGVKSISHAEIRGRQDFPGINRPGPRSSVRTPNWRSEHDQADHSKPDRTWPRHRTSIAAAC